MSSQTERDNRRSNCRSESRQCVFTLSVLLAVTAGMILMYRNLSDQMAKSITQIQKNDSDFQKNDTDYQKEWTEILAKTSTAENDISKLKQQLRSQQLQIKSLHSLLDSQLNNTVTQINNTVAIVEESMQQEVQKVNDSVSNQGSLMAYQFAGTFAILASLISFYHMMGHLRKFNEPFVQRKILAILWMCPIYSVTSWLSLVFVAAEGYLAVVKDFYEAYVIYTFLSFLIAVLGRGDRNAVVDLLVRHADSHHLKPPMVFNPFASRVVYPDARTKAEAVLHQCQLFAMQFVLLRPLTSIAMVISDSIHPSRWDWRYPQFYIMMIVNVSVFFAFSGLLKFYHAVQEDLRWCYPFSKFLCIKGVVFMTFWQGVAISFLAQTVYKKEIDGDANQDNINDDDYDPTEWSKQAQSFLICLEMFFFAIMHFFVFTTDEWEEGYRAKQEKRIKTTFSDNLALKDFMQDVKLVLSQSKRNMSSKKRRRRRRHGRNAARQDDFYNNCDDNFDADTEVTSQFEDVDSLNSLQLDDISEEEIDWSNGWSRIERYIDEVTNETEEQVRSNNDEKRGDETLQHSSTKQSSSRQPPVSEII